MSAGKGDKPRPVDKKEFDKNFDQIVWKNVSSSIKSSSTKKGKTTFKY